MYPLALLDMMGNTFTQLKESEDIHPGQSDQFTNIPELYHGRVQVDGQSSPALPVWAQHSKASMSLEVRSRERPGRCGAIVSDPVTLTDGGTAFAIEVLLKVGNPDQSTNLNIIGNPLQY